MKLTQDYIKERFSYNQKTGHLSWKNRPEHDFISKKYQSIFNARFANKESGSFCNGYLRTQIDKKSYFNHLIIWVYVYGRYPEKNIDHIDGNRANNKIENLREVTKLENAKNQKLYKNNGSGFSGVRFDKSLNKWRVQIGSGKNRKHIGIFEERDAAIRARQKAEKERGYHENHGRLK